MTGWNARRAKPPACQGPARAVRPAAIIPVLLLPVQRSGQLLAGVLVPGRGTLPQLAGIAAAGQPPGQLPPGVIVSQVGEQANHVDVADLGAPGRQQLRGPALRGADELAQLTETFMRGQPLS